MSGSDFDDFLNWDKPKQTEPAPAHENPFVTSAPKNKPDLSETDRPASPAPEEPERTKPEPTFDKIASEQGEQVGGSGKVIQSEGYDADEAPKPKGRGKTKKLAPEPDAASDAELLKKMRARSAQILRDMPKTQVHKRTRVGESLRRDLPPEQEAQLTRQFLRNTYVGNQARWRERTAALSLFAQVHLAGSTRDALPHLVDVLLTPTLDAVVFRCTFPGAVIQMSNPWGTDMTASQSTIETPDPRDGGGETWNIKVKLGAAMKIWDLDFHTPPPEPPDPMDVIAAEAPVLAAALADRDTPGFNRWRKVAKYGEITRSETRQKVVGGKAVAYESHAAPRFVDAGVGLRGPWIDIEPVHARGQTVGDIQSRGSRLASVLRCPDLRVDVSGGGQTARLNLNTKPLQFPAFVSAEPEDFTRPIRGNSEASVVKAYRDLVWPLGVTAEGRRLENHLATVPHTLVCGTTGCGKTRTMMSGVTALCVQGAQIIVCAAKADTWMKLMAPGQSPGVLHVATSRGGMLRAVAYVLHETQRRNNLVERGVNPESFTPLVLLFEEQAYFTKAMATDPALRSYLRALEKITLVGRSLGVHFIGASQRVEDKSFSNALLAQVSSRIALGEKEDMALSKLFDGSEAAAEAMASIAKSMKGRGVVLDTDTGEVELIQMPYIYSPGAKPGEYDKATPEMLANWERWKTALESTPRIQSRIGWAFETGVAGAANPWQEMDWEDLEMIRPINLDRQDENGDWIPVPERAIYDPTSSEYLGGISKSSGNHASIE
ncbi:hypothetical protein AXK56_11675 [Tsukamurella pulmonis]|uniref:FtsK domain-containing protein n=1 Tax=Tsukamurella pulmonis TaxID=47312 RepID=A0A1H1H622_9ACTN|nr:hypothetical protein [Tsukamurella pulmonis]KXO88039.1 hypothetical protein AXK56_11675 [Tsukamurella pulmonis]SDR20546.1 hypothetical protein SAMN04489765_3823 [Tsukamurella pulmonis]SUP15929.1 DNA segregation ATPase FtsK/SpoIIIE and related proteins [Tsukamurella pulmonis]